MRLKIHTYIFNLPGFEREIFVHSVRNQSAPFFFLDSEPVFMTLSTKSSLLSSLTCDAILITYTAAAYLLSRVQLFATPWTVVRQAPLSMGFFRQKYWSGLPFPSPGTYKISIQISHLLNFFFYSINVFVCSVLVPYSSY